MSTDDTTASEHGADAETTEVPPPPPGDEPGLAWSLDEPEPEPQRQPWGPVWGIVAVIAVCSVVAAGVTALVVWVLRSHHGVPSQPTAQPTTAVAAPPSPAPTTRVAAPPPVTVTVTPTAAPAPATTVSAAPAPVLSTADWQFLNAIGDIAAAPSPAYAITHAHAVCSYAAQHPNDYTGTIRFVRTTTIWDGNQAYQFADVAMQVYCPSALPADF
jgi:hypothetical protein